MDPVTAVRQLGTTLAIDPASFGAGIGPVPSIGAADAAGAAAGADFGAALKDAVSALSGTVSRANVDAARFASGADLDLSALMIEMQEAGLALAAGTAIRDKVLDAYHEIMRLQL